MAPRAMNFYSCTTSKPGISDSLVSMRGGGGFFEDVGEGEDFEEIDEEEEEFDEVREEGEEVEEIDEEGEVYDDLEEYEDARRMERVQEEWDEEEFDDEL